MRESAMLNTRRDWAFEMGNGKTIYVASQGTVINFDGSADPIPPRYIQLTRGLLYLAARQAAQLPAPDSTSGATRPHGIIPLDTKAQEDWVRRVEEDLAHDDAHEENGAAIEHRGGSLRQPRF